MSQDWRAERAEQPEHREGEASLSALPDPPPDTAGQEKQPQGQAGQAPPSRASTAAGPSPEAGMMRRGDVYTRPMNAGRPTSPLAAPKGLAAWCKRTFSTELQRREWVLDEQLLGLPGPTRPNVMTVLSPKGGVGKTTNTFLLGNLLADRLRLRVVAVDANPDFGTLAALAPDAVRTERSLADLIGEMRRIERLAGIDPFVSRLSTGLHLLGAPARAEVMAEMTPALYQQLVEFLKRFYEVVLLDCGTGVTDPIAQYAVGAADQTVVVTTPEWITAANVLGALRYLDTERATLVLNQAPAKNAGNREVIEANFRRQSVSTRVAIPYDTGLRTMLDSGTYHLEALSRPTRVPIKELGLAIGQHLR